MKIGYVIGRFPWPSETFISREVHDLIELGLDIQIYSFHPPTDEDVRLLSPSARALMARTQYISKADALLALPRAHGRMLAPNARFSREASAKSSGLLRLGRAAALAARARRDGVDALHAHWPYATQIAHLANAANGIGYSISVHAHEVAHEGGHFPAAFERLKLATFCNAAAMGHLLSQLDPSAERRCELVYHGVDIAAFPQIEAPPPGGPLNVISAGRMTASKGFDRLLEACARAGRQGIDITLTILGRGPVAERLEAQAKALDFADRLILPGWVGHDQVRDHLARSHVFALLADVDFKDGLPNVVTEAMACGRPVILSPLPAAAEAVRDGENGFLLKATDDIDGAVEAFSTLRDPEVARRMGQAARRTMIEGYDARMHIQRLAKLLKEAHG
jgi:colanic acid/amylovoran biosynthesis glycosyltransferase